MALPQASAAFRVLHVLREASGGMLTHLSALVGALAHFGVESVVAGPPESLQRLRQRLAPVSSGAGPIPPATFAALPLRDGLHPAQDAWAVLQLRRLLERAQPDVVHAHGHKAALVAAVVAGHRRHPDRQGLAPALVVTVHNLLPQRSRLRRAIDRRLVLSGLCRADRVVAVSGVLRQFVEGLGAGVPVRVVRNALDPARILSRGHGAGGEGETSSAGEPVVAACVMRLHRPKGVDALLEAARRLPPSSPVQVWVAGEGPERARLQKVAARLGLDGRVRFLGFEPDPARIWAAAKFAVLPYLREGSSYSALEAMASGLPVISFDCPGCREVLPDEASFAVPPRSVDALAEAMRLLAEDAALRRRMGEAARRAALRRTATDMASETLAVYREVTPVRFET